MRCSRPGIAELLAEHGIDAVAVCGHDVLEGQPDEQVLEVATKEGRCLVTENVRDFEVHRATWIEQGRDVAGLLYMSSRRLPRIPAATKRIVDAIAQAIDEERVPTPEVWIGCPDISGASRRLRRDANLTTGIVIYRIKRRQ
jgi:hypothetical protein